MDKVFIKGLKADAVIGVYDWEREIRQSLLLDLELGTDMKPAAETDDLVHTLDYASISNRLIEFIQMSEFKLIETLAERLASLLMEEFSIPWLTLRLYKPGAVAEADTVGVAIERGNWN